MTNIGEHRDEVRAYIRSLWREEPRYLGRILMQFTEDWGDKHRAFRLEDFGKLFDSAEVMDDIRTLGREAVAASHESKEAVELFEAALRQRKG